MNHRNPPRLAILLLKRFGLAADEAFFGDLIEEFRSGRTAGWFWRQTLTAIFAATRRTARRPDVRRLIAAYGIISAISVGYLEIRGSLPDYPGWTSLLLAAALFKLDLLTLALPRTGYWGTVRQCGWPLGANFCGILGLAWAGRAMKMGEAPVELMSLIILWQNIAELRREIRRVIKRASTEVQRG